MKEPSENKRSIGQSSQLLNQMRQLSQSSSPRLAPFTKNTSILIIKQLLIVKLLIISQVIRCDTSQQQQAQQRQHSLLHQATSQLLQQQKYHADNANKLRTTARQLIKTTSNYLHNNVKLANNADKNNTVASKLPITNSINRLHRDTNVPNASSKQHLLGPKSPHKSIQDQANSTGRFVKKYPSINLNRSHRHISDQLNSDNNNARRQNFSQSYHINPINSNSSRHQSMLGKRNRKNSSNLNDVLQMAASNFIVATTLDGKSVNLNPPYETMSKEHQHYYHNNNNNNANNRHHHDINMSSNNSNNNQFSDNMDVDIIGVNTNQDSTHPSNIEFHSNNYGPTHANLTAANNLDYITNESQPGNSDQQVSSSDHRLDYEIIGDADEHLMSDAINQQHNSADGNNNNNNNNNNMGQFKSIYHDTVPDTPGSDDGGRSFDQHNSNNRNFNNSNSQLMSDNHPVYPVLVRQQRQYPVNNQQQRASQSNNYFQLNNNSNNFRQQQYDRNDDSQQQNNYLSEATMYNHNDQLSTDKLIDNLNREHNPNQSQASDGIAASNTANNTAPLHQTIQAEPDQPGYQEQTVRLIEDEDGAGVDNQNVYHQSPPQNSNNEQQLMQNDDNNNNKSLDRVEKADNEASDNDNQSSEQQLARPTVGDLPVNGPLAPQLPIQYDSEIHMPPEGYYDDYFKPKTGINNVTNDGQQANNLIRVDTSDNKLPGANSNSAANATTVDQQTNNITGGNGWVTFFNNDTNSNLPIDNIADRVANKLLHDSATGNNNIVLSELHQQPQQSKSIDNISSDQFKNHRYNNLRAMDSSNHHQQQQQQQHHQQQINSNNIKHMNGQLDGRNVATIVDQHQSPTNNVDKDRPNSSSATNTIYNGYQAIQPKIEYYQNHAKMVAMSAVDQHYQNQLKQPIMDQQQQQQQQQQQNDNQSPYGSTNWLESAKKNHNKRNNKQGQRQFTNGGNSDYSSLPAHLNSNNNNNSQRGKTTTNIELINDDGPLIFGLKGANGNNNNSPDKYNYNTDNYPNDNNNNDNKLADLSTRETSSNDDSDTSDSAGNSSDNIGIQTTTRKHPQDQSSDWNNNDESNNNYEYNDARRQSYNNNKSIIDYDGTGYRRPINNKLSPLVNNRHNSTTTRRPVGGQQTLKNLVLSHPTVEPNHSSAVDTIRKLKEMKPQPDRNELMNELLTALDRVKVAIYKLQPLTAKVNAIYRKSVSSNTRDVVMDNHKGTYARRYPPGHFDGTYDRLHPSEKLVTGDSVPNAVYVPAPKDVANAYYSDFGGQNNKKLLINSSTTMASQAGDSSNSNSRQVLSTNVEIQASESSNHIPTIVATGVGRRLENGQVMGELEVTGDPSARKTYNNSQSLLSSHQSLSMTDDNNNSAAPDFVPEAQLNDNEPLFGYRITIFQSPDDYQVPKIRENTGDSQVDDEWPEEYGLQRSGYQTTAISDNNSAQPDNDDSGYLERRSDAIADTGPDDDDYMTTSESTIMEHEIQADASEMKKKYDGGGKSEEHGSGEESGGKKEAKKEGKMKKSEANGKKHHSEKKKKKEYKKIKQQKGIMKKEKKTMHRDKHVAAHDKGVAKEKALKERTQIEFFEREQIVDDEHEKGQKSLVKAGWQTGAESKKAMKFSANKPETYVHEDGKEGKDGMMMKKHSHYEKDHEDKMNKANLHSSNKYEKKNMEKKGKKFKGWREKGYKIITETEFIDRGSLHDSAYKKRDKGAAQHMIHKKQEASSEGHHGTIMEMSKKKSGEHSKKSNSKEHNSKKHKESMKKKKKHKKKKKKKEFEKDFENDHDHEESVMAATVTPRGNSDIYAYSNETAFETTLRPIYSHNNQSTTLNRLLSGGHDEKVFNFTNENPGNNLQLTRRNNTSNSYNRGLDHKYIASNVSVSFAGHRPTQQPVLSEQNKSILSSLQAILARQNSDIDIVDNSTGKHVNKTRLGIYKLEDSHVVKLANVANQTNNTSNKNHNGLATQSFHNSQEPQTTTTTTTTTTRHPLTNIDHSNQQKTHSHLHDTSSTSTTSTTAMPLLNTEIIPMKDSHLNSQQRINPRAISHNNGNNNQDDKQQVVVQTKHDHTAVRNQPQQQQTNVLRMNDKGGPPQTDSPTVILNQNPHNQQQISNNQQQQLNRGLQSIVHRLPSPTPEPSHSDNFINMKVADVNNKGLQSSNHQIGQLSSIFEQPNTIPHHHHQSILPALPQHQFDQQTHFLAHTNDMVHPINRLNNNYLSRSPLNQINNQQQYAQQHNVNNNINHHELAGHVHQQNPHQLSTAIRNNPSESQLFAQLNDQLVHHQASSIQHSIEPHFGKSMSVRPYSQIAPVIHESNLPLIDYDQDHSPVFPSSGYYISDAM